MQTQFQKGEYVRYAANGVCLVDDIRQMPELKREEYFYILRPIADRNSTYFIPVDNAKLTAKLRPLLTKEEIDDLIDSVRDVHEPWIEDRKERAELFRTILRECDMRAVLSLAGTIYLRKQFLDQEGKKLSPSDDSVLKQAESMTENEFAFVLHMQNTEVGPYVRERLGIET
ncbi:MAG: CarD family transcriptional regulator [Clostridia bacterium]|nr:CarD family transcriptional regulator [Clostridia bacterium]